MKRIVITLMTVLIMGALVGCNTNSDNQTPTQTSTAPIPTTIQTPTPTIPTPDLSTEGQEKFKLIKAKVEQELDKGVADFYDESKLSKEEIATIKDMKEAYSEEIATIIYSYIEGDITKEEYDSQIEQYVKAYYIIVGTIVTEATGE